MRPVVQNVAIIGFVGLLSDGAALRYLFVFLISHR